MNPKISIIVPIYNMEWCMRKCIDSVLGQTFTDFECLLIDDGSTDNSPAICDEYVQKDGRVKAFHKPNGGLSDARNFGLERAQGKYAIFADPDDWVDAIGLDKLYETAERENADMTICDLYREDDYARHYVSQKPSSLEPQNVLKELFINIGGFTVNKLVRKDLYTRYSIEYPIGLYGCEDQYVMALFLMKDIKIAYCPVAFYHYMYNPSSLTRKYDEHTYEMDLKILNLFSTLLKGTEAYPFAYKNKHDAIFTRAFWNGGDYYSSRMFRRRFISYQPEVVKFPETSIVKWCMYSSCLGFYQPAHSLVFCLFNVKRFFKRIIRKQIKL